MTTAAWVNLVIVWSIVVGVTVRLFVRVMTTASSNRPDDEGDSP
jgi:hypothetical protein